jgi:hypothetical protein
VVSNIIAFLMTNKNQARVRSMKSTRVANTAARKVLSCLSSNTHPLPGTTKHSMATTTNKFGHMLTGQITLLIKMKLTISTYLVGSKSQTKTATIKDQFRRLRTSIG